MPFQQIGVGAGYDHDILPIQWQRVQQLRSGTITSQELVIAGGTDGTIRSQTYDTVAITGWAVFGDGSADFYGDVDVGGTLTVLSPGALQSSNFSTGVSGWQIDGDGNTEFNDLTIRGDQYSDDWDGDNPPDLSLSPNNWMVEDTNPVVAKTGGVLSASVPSTTSFSFEALVRAEDYTKLQWLGGIWTDADTGLVKYGIAADGKQTLGLSVKPLTGIEDSNNTQSTGADQSWVTASTYDNDDLVPTSNASWYAEMKVTIPDLTPGWLTGWGGTMGLFGQWDGTGTGDGTHYFGIDSSGRLDLMINSSADARTILTSSVTLGSVGYIDGDTIWLGVAVTNCASDATVRFYHKASEGASWSQLGSDKTKGSAHAWASSGHYPYVGGIGYTGGTVPSTTDATIANVTWYQGEWGAGTYAFGMDFQDQTKWTVGDGAAATATDDNGTTWTVRDPAGGPNITIAQEASWSVDLLTATAAPTGLTDDTTDVWLKWEFDGTSANFYKATDYDKTWSAVGTSVSPTDPFTGRALTDVLVTVGYIDESYSASENFVGRLYSAEFFSNGASQFSFPANYAAVGDTAVGAFVLSNADIDGASAGYYDRSTQGVKQNTGRAYMAAGASSPGWFSVLPLSSVFTGPVQYSKNAMGQVALRGTLTVGSSATPVFSTIADVSDIAGVNTGTSISVTFPSFSSYQQAGNNIILVMIDVDASVNNYDITSYTLPTLTGTTGWTNLTFDTFGGFEDALGVWYTDASSGHATSGSITIDSATRAAAFAFGLQKVSIDDYEHTNSSATNTSAWDAANHTVSFGNVDYAVIQWAYDPTSSTSSGGSYPASSISHGTPGSTNIQLAYNSPVTGGMSHAAQCLGGDLTGTAFNGNSVSSQRASTSSDPRMFTGSWPAWNEDNSPITVLPVGLRPSQVTRIPVANQTGTDTFIQINTDGYVYVVGSAAGDIISLDGAVFYA